MRNTLIQSGISKADSKFLSESKNGALRWAPRYSYTVFPIRFVIQNIFPRKKRSVYGCLSGFLSLGGFILIYLDCSGLLFLSLNKNKCTVYYTPCHNCYNDFQNKKYRAAINNGFFILTSYRQGFITKKLLYLNVFPSPKSYDGLIVYNPEL